jgi:hypothetical protein
VGPRRASSAALPPRHSNVTAKGRCIILSHCRVFGGHQLFVHLRSRYSRPGTDNCPPCPILARAVAVTPVVYGKMFASRLAIGSRAVGASAMKLTSSRAFVAANVTNSYQEFNGKVQLMRQMKHVLVHAITNSINFPKSLFPSLLSTGHFQGAAPSDGNCCGRNLQGRGMSGENTAHCWRVR